MIRAYARVSTKDQNLQLQLDAFDRVSGGEHALYHEKVSAVAKRRPQLEKLLDELEGGDVVLIWKLDRLGRSVVGIIKIVAVIRAKGASVKSITDGIDTSDMSPGAQFYLTMFAAFSELERGLIRERTMAGVAAARSRGKLKGRGPKFSEVQIAAIRQMHADGKPVPEIAEVFGVHRTTIYRHL